ncbi:MAG: N-acetylglucosaminyl-diphospho-decaprenol L-rhamnosyltransferase [Deltaproteobacteria bacterium ADurb.Bin510]|nr:MAG: N-acetylglucosaminyl-diphospho-decaprenol L-rhamnosyltransferase [Deltaproteobacteria bacterium ADurb.Bin510]
MEMISVIIVTLGEDEVLRECLASLRTHAALSLETIVVNNGAEPLSAGLADIVIENGRNLGFARAVNRGIAASHGDYVLLLNSDTRFTADILGDMRAFMDAHARAGIAGVQLVFEDGRLQNSVDIIPTLATQFLNKSLLKILFPRRYPSKRSGYSAPVKVPSVIGACMLIRRSLIEAIGGLDEGFFFYLEETDFCLRAARHGYEIWHLPQLRLVHYQGLSAKKINLRRKLEFSRSMSRFFRKNHGLLSAGLLWLLTVVKLTIEFGGNLVLSFIPKLREKCKASAVLLVWHLLGQPAGWGIERLRPVYRRVRAGGYDWLLPPQSELPQPVDPAMIMDELAGPVLNSSRTTFIKTGRYDGAAVYFKRYNYKGWLDGLKNRFRKSRARHCLEMAQVLEQLGLDTPEVLWACEKTSVRRDGYILTRGVAALNLVEHVARRGCDQGLIIRLAAFVRRLHQLGVLHVDLKGENLLVDEQQRFYLIDLDRCRIVRHLSLAARAKNLSYLNASFVDSVPAELRTLFLTEYVKGETGLEARSAWLAARIAKLTVSRRARRY